MRSLTYNQEKAGALIADRAPCIWLARVGACARHVPNGGRTGPLLHSRSVLLQRVQDAQHRYVLHI